MPNIQFSCFNCDQHLMVDESAAGQSVQCPSCDAAQVMPTAVTPPQSGQEKEEFPQTEPPANDVWDAAYEGDMEAFQWHLSAGANINVQNEDGWTPLHMAVNGNQKETAALLLGEKVDVNSRNDVALGQTPLDVAIENQQVGMVSLLRQHGGKRSCECQSTRDESTAVPAVDPLNATLFLAIQQGSLEAVSGCIESGADVNTRGTSGATPLHESVAAGWNYITAMLIENGAEVNAVDDDGNTPADLTAKPEIVSLLCRHGGQWGSMYSAPRHEDIQAVEKWIKKGAKVDAREPGTGFGILHYAAKSGNSELVGWILGRGGDPNLRNKAGQTPLDLAMTARHTDMVVLLKKKGSRRAVELPADSIREAIEKGQLSVVSTFLVSGTSANGLDETGMMPLFHAAKAGKLDIVQLLLRSGARVDVRNEDGATALHGAAWAGINKIIELLLEKGVDINAMDVAGKTALDYAWDGFAGEDTVALLSRFDAIRTTLPRQQIALTRENGEETELVKKGRPLWLNVTLAVASMTIILSLLPTIIERVNGLALVWHSPPDSEMRLIMRHRDPVKRIDSIMIERGDVDGLKQRIEDGFPVPLITSLHLAVGARQLKIVGMLLKQGADVNAKSNEGTPLDNAQKSDPDIADLLRKYGGKTGKELDKPGLDHGQEKRN